MFDVPALMQPMKDRLAAATPGPWELYDSNDGEWPPRPLWSVANDEFHNPTGGDDDPWPAFNAYVETGAKEDAELIAHAPTDQAKLIAAVEAVDRVCSDWAKLADGDKYYAAKIRAALTQALGGDTA